MDEIRFQTELTKDQTIHIPAGTEIPSGIVEVTVRKCSEASASPSPDPFASPESYPSVWDWLQAVGRQAESWEHDLPADLAENHDHYAHGTPRK